METEWLATWSMVFLRASGLLVVFPVFSAPTVPTKLRVAMGAMLAFLITPGLPRYPWESMGLIEVMMKMAMEIGVGVLLGFICKMLFFALDFAGSLISTEMGLSLPPSINPFTNSQSTLPAGVLNFLAIIVWLTLDLHHWLLMGFSRSFELLPIGMARLSEPALSEVLRWTGLIFVIGLQLAAPVMAVSFIISLVFSVLGRAVSQMNVFTESFAVRIFAGLFVFGMTIPLMAQHIANYLARLPEDMLRVAVYLKP